MTDPQFYCPRGHGPNSPFKAPFNGEASWREDNCCSYCGSLNPEEFMRRLEAGDVSLVPTDKSYKVYVDGPGLNHQKFYFQHLSPEQQTRFIELYNAHKLRLGVPGYFYQLPYFCSRVAPKPPQDDGA